MCSAELHQMLRDRGYKPREVHTGLLDVLAQQLVAGGPGRVG